MSESFVRHLVAFAGTLMAGAIFAGGYLAGTRGWWWAAVSVVMVYAIVYNMVTAGGHGHH